MKNPRVDVILSPLEKDILNVLWANNSLRVREIYRIIKPKRQVALTSVAVILDRLHGKKIVSRKVETGRGGARYIYSSIKNKQEFEISVIDNLVNRLIKRFGSTAINYFDERFSNNKKGE